MPRFRENLLIAEFSMLCPGISQNAKHHHLTLYKGQVWREKSYLKLCNHNVLNIVYGLSANWATSKGWPMELNGELYVPPVPGRRFINGETMIAWDSEILQSFSELANITLITFHNRQVDPNIYNKGITYQIIVGSYVCSDKQYHEQCVHPINYIPWYIWTKAGFKR